MPGTRSVASRLEPMYREILVQAFASRPSDFEPWFFDYFSEYSTVQGPRRYARALAADLALAKTKAQDAVIVDAGSGFGLALLGFAAAGARIAVGIEPFEPMAKTAHLLHARYAGALAAAVVRGSVEVLPFADETVDFVYCNEAFSHFRNSDGFLDEAARVLKRGGRLMICDGNNGANRRTVKRVHEIWRRFEEGPPAENIHGHRVQQPYRDRRRAMIAAAIPNSSSEVLEKLAWGTFGLSGPAVLSRARELVKLKTLPAHPPVVDRSPVDPTKGDLIENLIFPAELARKLAERGFKPSVFAHFAGARGPLYSLVNGALRAMTPLTLRWARSLKIVAVRL